VDLATQKVICTSYANGKCHDFRLFKNSNIRCLPQTKILVDTGYLGMAKIRSNVAMPKKKSKKHPLTSQDKKLNQQLSSERVLNEHVIGKIKRFKIVADKYRNRRKRFALRFNLISGIYNYELR